MILFMLGDSMKKGFTLAEVIAIIVILGVISLIAVPAVNKAIIESRQKAYNSQVEIILEASKRWGVDNNEKLATNGNTYELQLGVLIAEQYITNIEDGKLKNPMARGTFMEGCVYIYYSENYNQYIYEYDDEC